MDLFPFGASFREGGLTMPSISQNVHTFLSELCIPYKSIEKIKYLILQLHPYIF